MFAKKDRALLVAGLAATILLSNIKFTGLVILGFFLVTYGLASLFKSFPQKKVELLAFAGSLVLAVGAVGFNPYVTNAIHNGHPFYPLFGKGSVDIISTNINPDYAKMNRFSKLAYSVFGKTENSPRTFPQLKVPCQVSLNELKVFTNNDPRIGGFGPLFGIVTLISLALLGWLAFSSPIPAGLVVLIPLFLSIIINGECWWARYVPQLWLFPILVAGFALAKKWKLPSLCAATLLALMLTNLLAIAGVYFGSQVILTRNLNRQLMHIAALSKGTPVEVYFNRFVSNRVRLKEHGIQFHTIDHPLATSQSIKLVRSQTCVYFTDSRR
jgi:hypothetical protein